MESSAVVLVESARKVGDQDQRFRLAVLASHPVQYSAPFFRQIATRMNLHVFYTHKASPDEQARAGFGEPFNWDIDLSSGYDHTFLENVASRPSADNFFGCDTPDIGRALDAGAYDALLIEGWRLKSFLQGLVAAKRRAIPVLVRGDSVLTHQPLPKRLVKRAVYPFFLRLYSAALYVGHRSHEYYAYFNYPEERLFFSPHCVDGVFFAKGAQLAGRETLRNRLGIVPGTSLILFAGKLLPNKRPLDLLQAIAILRRAGRNVAAVIAGSGPLKQRVIDEAAVLNVPTYMLGFQNQTEMPAVYAGCDILVLPSIRETWGLVCNEAIACGRPVIVSDGVGCAPDLAADARIARVFPCGKVEALAAAIEGMLDFPPRVDEIENLGRSYSISAAVDGLERALKALLGRGSWPI
jgi:glycosyltransferase involved in cell wall biosynthesis